MIKTMSGLGKYNKNQLYTGEYEIDEGGEIELPDNCEWLVGVRNKKAIGLLLLDVENRFAPVISVFN